MGNAIVTWPRVATGEFGENVVFYLGIMCLAKNQDFVNLRKKEWMFEQVVSRVCHIPFHSEKTGLRKESNLPEVTQPPGH